MWTEGVLLVWSESKENLYCVLLSHRSITMLTTQQMRRGIYVDQGTSASNNEKWKLCRIEKKYVCVDDVSNGYCQKSIIHTSHT